MSAGWGSSSVGGSAGLQNRRSQVRVLAAPLAERSPPHNMSTALTSGLRRSALAALLTCAAVAISSPIAAAAPTCFGRRASLVGTERADRIVGTPGPDIVTARGGDDVILGRGGGDLV